MKHASLTDQIIKAAFKVHNILGFGFLEKVYQNAMSVELERSGLEVAKECATDVYYEDVLVGQYFADLIVEHKVILELKAVKTITNIHEVQLVNYLKATGIEVGLLINFGHSVEIKRKVMDRSNPIIYQ
ncbi:MAG: GxxExxY protein [Deltaproteobacteria bacterium]|jgi:GxxExxY protein|nr:GxxExxY protein [Deltaproteobacteria bacterium]